MVEESVKEPAKIGAFLVIIMIAYIIYVFMLHPWERQAIVTRQAEVTVNVIDCTSGYPITGVGVTAYTESGELIDSGMTESEGTFVFSTYPDCISIKATHGESKWEGVCLGSGINRSVNFCFDEPAAAPNVLYYNDFLGVIGSTSGDVITEKSIGEVELSYPTINASVYYHDYYLLSNILWSERLSLELKDINESSTKQVIVSFIVESVKGSPKAQVIVNNQLIIDRPVSNGDFVFAAIPKQLINETMHFDIACGFTGWLFWSTQDCNLTEIKAVQEYYLPVKTAESFNFSTSEVDRNSELTNVRFYSSTNSSAPINVSINGVRVFSSDSLANQYYTGSVNTSVIELHDDGNQLVFETGAGGEPLLEEVSVSFYAKDVATTSKSFNFTATTEQLIQASSLKIRFYVSEVFLEGQLVFIVNNRVLYPKTISKAGWNELIIDRQDVSNSNGISVTAPQGRFMINELIINYEE